MKQINETTFTSDNGLITFINGDCMDVMNRGEKWDLAVVDPPYNIGGDSLHSNRALKGAGKLKNRAINRFCTKWDDIAPTKEYFDLLLNKSDSQIIWGGNYFELPKCRCFLVWDKIQPWENFSACEYAWSSFNSPSKIYREATTMTGETKIHPTQKSVKLYRWIFKNYAKPTDHILDTHGGSMSSAIAAHMEGLKMTIIELDKEYFDKAIQRFANYERQQTINFE